MDNKGFTLIELLAVVVILAIIMIIAAPSMTKQIAKSEKENQNILNKKIENASHLFVAKYYSNKLLSQKESSSTQTEISFTINQLQEDGLLNVKDNCQSELEKNIVVSNGIYKYDNVKDNNDCYKD